MDEIELRQAAADAVEAMRDAALEAGPDWSTTSHAHFHANLEWACGELRRMVADTGDATNPRYRSLGTLASKLVLLAERGGPAFGGFMGTAGTMPDNAYGRLVSSSNLLRAISDDHEYVIFRTADGPSVRGSWETDGATRLLGYAEAEAAVTERLGGEEALALEVATRPSASTPRP